MTTESQPLIDCRNVRKIFPDSAGVPFAAVDDVSFRLSAGEIVGLLGPDGAGKTTLLQIMGTLDRADAGTVELDGIDVGKLGSRELSRFRNRNIGFVFQAPQLLNEFTALENIMIPAYISKADSSETRRRAEELLEFVGLSQRSGHKPLEMSGGEQQRVAVARALINNPTIIFADEPSGSLDSKNKQELHKLFFDLREHYGQTFVIVTHDETLAAQTDRTIHMADGLVAAPAGNDGQEPAI